MTAASYHIEGGDFEHGGTASRSLKEQLKKVGADPAVVRRAMVAAYEAEMNVVIHARRGELRARLQNGQLDVEVIDEGPGIPDLERAMRPGFSTASAAARELGFGAGMGLPNIKKNSDHFAIESTVDSGTRVCFTIVLKPQALYGAGRNSLHIAPEKCRQSFRCIQACPTQALRVFRGKPEVLDYLCIDCTACIAVCPSATLTMRGDGETVTLPPPDGATLLVTPAALMQFGAGVGPRRVLDELAALGWSDVPVTDAWESALLAATVAYAQSETNVTPVISPACPAVVNLVETRFPSLIPHLAPFASAGEAAMADLHDRRVVPIVTCPCQRTAAVPDQNASSGTAVLSPSALRAAVAPRVRHAATESTDAPVMPAHPPGFLRVTGVRHVMSVLEAIENGLADDFRVVEPWICDAGCFGSPLLTEPAFLARARWERAVAGHALVSPATPAQAHRRTSPFTPRPGLRLDQDMSRAIQKLAKIDKLTRSLPGSDCGMCGAPTCAALAEDIVLGRAGAEACVRQHPAQEKPS